MTEKAWITDTSPSERFPVFTRLNAADVMADPITPLGASMCWIPQVLPGWAAGYVQDLCFTPEELTEESAVAGFFYGYLYVNQSSVRVLGIRKGLTWEAIDAAFFNSPGAPPHDPSPSDINPELSALAPARAGWVLTTTRFAELEEDRRLADTLRVERPPLGTLSNRALIARARAMMPYERLAWRSEQIATSNAAVGPTVAGTMLPPEKAHLIVTILGHAGDVDSAAPTYALWDLSRQVRTDPELTALFDSGVQSAAEAISRSTGGFASAFATFLHEFGYRGPGEWDLGAPSWETQPTLALGLIDRMRHLADEESPSARQAAQASATDKAMAEATAGMDPATEAAFRGAIASGRRFASWRERGKTVAIKILNEARVALVELGQRLTAEGVIEHPAQVFMALDSELDALALGSPVVGERLAQREREWMQLRQLQVPTFIDASKPLPSLDSLPRKGSTHGERVTPGEVLTGAAASQGVAEGRARVVLSTEEISDFQPGEILIAPQTDPSWTPLFMVASAVVVDTGSMGSHAMIVARELGIPCVAGMPGATERIATGDVLRVDGERGTVEVVETV